jgi:hypothetical protein
MTTIVAIRLRCPECEEIFQGSTLGSMGYRATDDQFCREYWGLNPMPFFVSECPKCKHVDWTGNFETLDEEPNQENIEIKTSCDIYERFIDQLIASEEDAATIAFVSQQSGCCKRINGEDPTLQFQRAADYFRKAKSEGLAEFGNLSIDEWIKRMQNTQKI